ncbi:DUF5683 domain-containing protein [Spirosoma agri]|uniref:DUF5683 domain-containing protein n=1 Tax=Spirosoma agri TaxID=1987381 RepID=A0A6M0IDK9_9BACT|nr:DUF5683 domain-containing protein [Spirosoma agri]NEU66370.1 hypothetical protein [Spirosoma agri]
MKQHSAILVLFLLVALPAFAQRPAIVPAPTPAPTDSTRQLQSATDTIPAAVQRNGIRVGSSVLTPEGDSASLATDTTEVTASQEAKIRKIIPRKATMRSLILPGLGQAYNRQYYKIPFIYAGFGVMGYLFLRYRNLANQAEEGYRLLKYGRPNGTNTPDPVTSVVIGSQIITTQTGAKSGYDLYRSYRDLNILLSLALWGVNIVEANVAAHLKTFDLSDDISMRIEPRALPMPGAGLVPGVRIAFTFK